MSDSEPVETSLIPFPSGVLSEEHEQQVIAIRSCFKTWLSSSKDCRKELAGSRERMQAAMEELRNLKVDAPYAYTPAPPYTYRRVLLSCTKTYWLALLASLEDSKKEEVGRRLDAIPPYGKRVPQFKGKRCIEKADELNQKEYEGLMRTASYVIIGLVSDEAVEWWQELSEVGVLTWEEQD